MAESGIWQRLLAVLRVEWNHLTALQSSDRRWQMPLAAALASGLPLVVGAAFHRLDYGLVSSLGGLVFLYLPHTPLHHRMTWLMCCAFGMTACYALGLVGHFFPPLTLLSVTVIAILVTMLCRYYDQGPPASLFFVMSAAIGAYSPLQLPEEMPTRVGLLALGSLLACLIAFFYSLHIVRLQAPQPVKPPPAESFDYVVLDSVVIGAFVGLSLLLAQLLQLPRPYWVPVSCLAVIQGATMRAVWNRQLHRVLGTALGLLLAWVLLALPLDAWRIAALVILLSFAVETLVVRHYGLAVVFITPLTILLAEAATLGQGSTHGLVLSRFFDTVLGCAVGLAGGACLHSPRFRAVAGRTLRRLMPARLRQTDS